MSNKKNNNPVRVSTVVDYLNHLLAMERFDDASHNGLQVENSGRLGVVCCGVDASMEFFEAARDRGAGLLICHHGISWGDSLAHLRGLSFRQVAFLVKHDMALWACHLPLDAHPKYGNNACLARALGLKRLTPFGEYHGQTIGYCGALERARPWEDFKRRVQRVTGSPCMRALDFGVGNVKRVGVISGGAAAETEQAAEMGLDAYVSGEVTLQGYNLARQLGINAIFAGHYATERFGVRALGEHVRQQFGVDAALIDFDIPV